MSDVDPPKCLKCGRPNCAKQFIDCATAVRWGATPGRSRMVELTPCKEDGTIIRNFAHPDWIRYFSEPEESAR